MTNDMYWSQMAHPAKPYPGFLKIKRLVGVLILPPGLDANAISAFHSVSPTMCRNTPGWSEAL